MRGLVIAGCVLFAVGACNDGGSDEAATEAPSVVTATAPTGGISTPAPVPLLGYASDVWTHGAADAVIDPYLRGRVTRLLDHHVQFQHHECRPADTPPCATGADAVDGIPLWGCDAGWATRETLLGVLRPRGEERALYAVAPASLDGAPEATQVAVFNWRDATGDDWGFALLLASASIVAIDEGCGDTARDLYDRYAAGEARLPPAAVAGAPAPPLSPPPGYAPDVSTGNPDVDRVVRAYLAGDVLALEALARYTEYACVEEPVHEYGPPPVCPDGVEVGTPLPVLGHAGCHGGYTTPERIQDALRPSSEEVARTLYAVTLARDEATGSPRYVAVFARQFRSGAVWGEALTVERGGYTSIFSGCGFEPDLMVSEFTPGEFVLPPAPGPGTPSPPPLTPGGTVTGDAAVDGQRGLPRP